MINSMFYKNSQSLIITLKCGFAKQIYEDLGKSFRLNYM